MPFFNTVGKGLLAVVSVGMGASLGREAAPKQMGTAAGALFANWANLSNVERRLVAACGAGAGIAAVYNVPLGGALFALKVLLGRLARPLIPPLCLHACWQRARHGFFCPTPRRIIFLITRWPRLRSFVGVSGKKRAYAVRRRRRRPISRSNRIKFRL